jgi:hypothetical protein
VSTDPHSLKKAPNSFGRRTERISEATIPKKERVI